MLYMLRSCGKSGSDDIDGRHDGIERIAESGYRQQWVSMKRRDRLCSHCHRRTNGQ